jgi:hypothetical protein
MFDRLRHSLLLAFVIACIALDALAQVWIEWKRLLWGECAMVIREKIELTLRRVLQWNPR